ncbi:hypothetical protein EB796_004429 [Bugula neritina]|uniref:Uncharacterized protein n=2 Tax=Bugula neritina TaxID=10212 RepID=A0A7J7KG93_BUGNE|nr:hypothetical protein EB796_004429 [Bugula neritina]
MFKEESEANRRAIIEHQKREESENIEKKLAFQHKAFRGEQGDVVDALKDVTLPSLYNRNTGNNVYNPRVFQYFHPTGTTGLRLTQPPSMMSLPPLKHKMSVINLFDVGQSIHNPNQLLQRYMSIRNDRENGARTDAPVNTADQAVRKQSMPRNDHPLSAGERLQSTSTYDD